MNDERMICSIGLNPKHNILTVKGEFRSKGELKNFVNELKDYVKTFKGVDDK